MKKPKTEKGVGAFSKITTASIVRVKKPVKEKPSNCREDNAVVVGKSSGATNEEHKRTNDEGKEEGEEGNTKTSLSLLGSYDSTSDSDGSS